MEKKTVLMVGLEKSDITTLRQKTGPQFIVLHYEMLPVLKLLNGVLLVESQSITGRWNTVDMVIFHGIFENDKDTLTLLALWGGPCLPGAQGMMDLRSRIPGLARALRATRFGGLPRGMVIGTQSVDIQAETVAKWGIWHCGEDKEKFAGQWTSTETSVLEPFIQGEAVRIMMIGKQHWQIRLTGNDWLKSIHHADAAQMDTDPLLLEDARHIQRHFKLEMLGIDYMVGHDGNRYLLEVNHIPNVTVFPFMNEAFLKFAAGWVKRQGMQSQRN